MGYPVKREATLDIRNFFIVLLCILKDRVVGPVLLTEPTLPLNTTSKLLCQHGKLTITLHIQLRLLQFLSRTQLNPLLSKLGLESLPINC
jgi:hypothetical protein